MPGQPKPVGTSGGGCLLGIRLKPAASREKIVSVGADEAVIAVTAAPVDGKANEALIRFLAKALDVSKSSLRITKGLTSRNKLVEIGGMTKTEAVKRLSGY
jgi:uncharacterized protein (TIGR00251 family)